MYQKSLPIIDGVSASKIYLPNIKECAIALDTILDFLCYRFKNINQQEWIQRFEDKMIFLEKPLGIYQSIPPNTPYIDCQNHILYYYRRINQEIVVPFDYRFVFENERFIVVDKPHFLTTAPAGQYAKQTLLARLKNDTQILDLTPIHRLDKDTAGLVLFCKQPKYRSAYQALFAKQKIQKIYHAIAPVCADLSFPMQLDLCIMRGEPFYTMRIFPNQKPNSSTYIDIIQYNNNKQWAKYQLIPQTGKLHQLRVHLNYLRIPIKNDPYYPVVCHKKETDFTNPLQLLAKSIQFIDPIDQKTYFFQSKKELILD